MRSSARSHSDDVTALARWFAMVRQIIEHHHHLEDDELWPDLERRLPGFLAGTTELAADHVRLDEAMDAVTAGLDQLTTTTDDDAVDEAVASAADLAELIVDHLDREERSVIGPITAAYTAEEYERFEKSAAKGTPLRLFAFGLPWLLDGVDDATRRNVLAPMPAAARLLFRPFRWWYRRIAAPSANR